MNRPGPQQPSPALSALALALLAVGLIDAAAVGWRVALDGAAATSDAIGSPLMLWTVWVAVILTVLSSTIHQPVRYAVALGALVAGSFRAGLHVLVLTETLPTPQPAITFLESIPPLLGPLLLALWAVVDALRRRPARPAAATAPVAEALPEPIRMAPLPPSRPSSPTTPISHPARRPAPIVAVEPGWNKVASPWPRAVEDDPDGTLLRPPRRRTAL